MLSILYQLVLISAYLIKIKLIIRLLQEQKNEEQVMRVDRVPHRRNRNYRILSMIHSSTLSLTIFLSTTIYFVHFYEYLLHIVINAERNSSYRLRMQLLLSSSQCGCLKMDTVNIHLIDRQKLHRRKNKSPIVASSNFNDLYLGEMHKYLCTRNKLKIVEQTV